MVAHETKVTYQHMGGDGGGGGGGSDGSARLRS